MPPPPSPTFTRSVTLVKHLHVDLYSILTLFLLCMCLTVITLSNIDLNCRFVCFRTRLNTLRPKSSKNTSHHFLLFFLSYVMLFEYYFIIFLPYEFLNVHLNIKARVKSLNVILKMVHCGIANTTLGVCHRLTVLSYIHIACFCNYPLETIALWIFLMRLALCPVMEITAGDR